MVYRLHIDPTIHELYRALPDDARRDLGACLLDAMDDPLAHSEPFGYDDGTWRTVARGYTTAAITLDHNDKVITVVHITYAG